MEENVDRISSSDLAARMHVTASQIRQDLNTFGGFGQQGYGYHVEHLHAEIGKLLGIDQQKYIVIIGAGHLGQALANYQNFTKRGFQVRHFLISIPRWSAEPFKVRRYFPWTIWKRISKRMPLTLRP
jgi:redox-sensing transcriptional repressor rex